MATDNAADETQITVRFKTKLPEKFKVPENPVAVPGKLTRYGLSQVVNGLLQLETPRPFDFLVAGQLVRQPLQALVTALGISAELVLDVEYTTAALPPKLKNELPHDDWVSAVTSSTTGSILAGCYDGLVRIWTGTGEQNGSFAAHKGRVTAVAALPGGGPGAKAKPTLALSAGQDGTARLWQIDDSARQSSSDAATLVAVCKGHKDTVAALAVAPGGGHFASAGWDDAIHIWRTGPSIVEEAEEARADATATAGVSKRRKSVASSHNGDGDAGSDGAAPKRSGSAALELGSEQLLSGHRQCAAALTWRQPGTLVSGSWDHSVRLWDVATGVNHETLDHNKAVLAVAAPPADSGSAAVAFGGSEGIWRLWDPRAQKGENLAVKAFPSHTDWVVAIAWHPASAVHLATGSHDGSVKLWDTRTAVPLHTIDSHTDKVLSVAWTAAGQLASGGADCQLHIHDVQLPVS